MGIMCLGLLGRIVRSMSCSAGPRTPGR